MLISSADLTSWPTPVAIVTICKKIPHVIGTRTRDVSTILEMCLMLDNRNLYFDYLTGRKAQIIFNKFKAS